MPPKEKYLGICQPKKERTSISGGGCRRGNLHTLRLNGCGGFACAARNLIVFNEKVSSPSLALFLSGALLKCIEIKTKPKKRSETHTRCTRSRTKNAHAHDTKKITRIKPHVYTTKKRSKVHTKACTLSHGCTQSTHQRMRAHAHVHAHVHTHSYSHDWTADCASACKMLYPQQEI